jgi:hypothetical protein
MISEAAAGGDVPDDDALAHSHALAYLDPSRKKTPRASSQPAVVGLTPELVDLFAMRRVLNAIRT